MLVSHESENAKYKPETHYFTDHQFMEDNIVLTIASMGRDRQIPRWLWFFKQQLFPSPWWGPFSWLQTPDYFLEPPPWFSEPQSANKATRISQYLLFSNVWSHELLLLRCWLRSRAQEILMLCKLWTVTSHRLCFFHVKIRWNEFFIIYENWLPSKTLCIAFLIGLWVKIRNGNTSAFS